MSQLLGGQCGRLLLLLTVVAKAALYRVKHADQLHNLRLERFKRAENESYCEPVRTGVGLECCSKSLSSKDYLCTIGTTGCIKTQLTTSTIQPSSDITETTEDLSKDNTEERSNKISNALSNYHDNADAVAYKIQKETNPLKKKQLADKALNEIMTLAGDVQTNPLPADREEEAMHKMINIFERVGPSLASAVGRGQTQKVENDGLVTFSLNMDLAVRTHNDSLTSKGNRLDIPRKSLRDVAKGSDTIGVFVAIFDRIKWKGLSQIFRLKVEASRDSNEDVGEDSFINTDVILVSVQSTQSHIKLSEDITMTYKLGRTDTVRPVCSSLHSNAQTINTKGCTSIRVESAYVSCTCNHLTSFAVLMSVDRPSTEDDVTSVLTYCCLTLSIVFLLLAFITFVTFGNLKCTRNSIHIHLCACLGLAQLIFMAGAEQTGNKTVCAVIAGVLHFLFLAAFSWMGVEGMQIYMKLIIVFRTTSSFIIIYYGLGYGVPAVVVFVSAAVYHQGYGTDSACWLSTDRWFHLSFIIPAVLILVWNLIMLIISAVIMIRHFSSSSRREATRMENLKSQVKGIATLTSIMGITWLFGLLVMGNTVGKVFEYLFVLMNATQGVFVFFFHCFFNKKVKTEYRRWIRNSTLFPMAFRRLFFSIMKTDSDQTFSKSMAQTSTLKDTLQSTDPEHSVVITARDKVGIDFEIKPPSKANENSFRTKDVSLPEISPFMVLDSGVYMGDVVKESGIYMGDDEAQRQKKTQDSQPKGDPQTAETAETVETAETAETAQTQDQMPAVDSDKTDPKDSTEQDETKLGFSIFQGLLWGQPSMTNQTTAEPSTTTTPRDTDETVPAATNGTEVSANPTTSTSPGDSEDSVPAATNGIEVSAKPTTSTAPEGQ